MRAGTGRKLKASPARASLSAASVRARYIDGCCPAFLPVLMTSFLAMPGTGVPLSFRA
jgi:hypothetical protein